LAILNFETLEVSGLSFATLSPLQLKKLDEKGKEKHRKTGRDHSHGPLFILFVLKGERWRDGVPTLKKKLDISLFKMLKHKFRILQNEIQYEESIQSGPALASGRGRGELPQMHASCDFLCASGGKVIKEVSSKEKRQWQSSQKHF